MTLKELQASADEMGETELQQLLPPKAVSNVSNPKSLTCNIHSSVLIVLSVIKMNHIFNRCDPEYGPSTSFTGQNMVLQWLC